VTPGSTYLITRRCYQRTFRLRPSKRTRDIMLYCLARAARVTGVVVHAVCVMSNHHHLVVTDVSGVLPDFLRELHRSSAKALNASQGQWENLWSAEQTNAVKLGDDDDVIEKMAYVITNPVDSGLVASPEEWPGVNLWGDKELRATRPDQYFDPMGTAPEAEVLAVASPPLSVGTSYEVADWRRRLTRAIARRVAEAHRLMAAAGLQFLGASGVLAQSFVQRARSYEVKRARVPQVAAKDRELRADMLRAIRVFQGAYRAALDAWRNGVRSVVFPFGTWWFRVHHAARIAPAPA
jgi:REP element-mobilizing transposase RayT